MELYIVRHGKTVWNKERRLQGSIDIELAEEGIEAAEQLHDQLHMANIHFDRIYSSPLKRALKTAEIIRGLSDTEIIIDERIKEISFGVEEGAFYADWDKEDSPFYPFFNKPGDYIPPEKGESIEDLCLRTKKFIQEVIEPQYKTAKKILLVAHGALNSSI
ncbi:MAG: histidine phosphatase family protein, partial [Treponema sp.]|nr:histidine phosphatase family protein [Candidatus Treponema equi]